MTDFLKIAKSIVVHFAHICAYGVETVNRQSSRDILNIYNWVWLWVWLGHAVVFLSDLSHLRVPRCPDKRGKDVL